MPWYQVVQRLIGTAIHVGSPVPNDSYGYGIINVAKAVNASSFPVSASSPDPVYARYLAWLRSPAGETWAKANGVRTPSAPSTRPAAAKAAPAGQAAAHAPGSGGLGTLLMVIVVVAVLIAAAAIALVLRSRNRSRRA
jgi:hypothetical protein